MGKEAVDTSISAFWEGGIWMRYRIEYKGSKCCDFVKGKDELIAFLRTQKKEIITDIRKLYKSGISDSVMETYAQYMA